LIKILFTTSDKPVPKYFDFKTYKPIIEKEIESPSKKKKLQEEEIKDEIEDPSKDYFCF